MTRRRPALRMLLGAVLLALALGAALAARGVDQAARQFRELQAASGAARVEPEPGALQQAGERVLGVSARARLLRAYAAYRAGLAEVIPGTVYPQTQARWDAIAAISRLRSSLHGAEGAQADLVLGRVYAAAADAAGPTTQRVALRDSAVAALRRSVLEEPSDAEAKHDLEALLAQAGAAEAKARSSNGRRTSEGKLAKVPRAELAGSGY